MQYLNLRYTRNTTGEPDLTATRVRLTNVYKIERKKHQIIILAHEGQFIETLSEVSDFALTVHVD